MVEWKYDSLTQTIESEEKTFNARPVGPGPFNYLRKQNYGEGFKQGTFRDQFDLLHITGLNKDKEIANRLFGIINPRSSSYLGTIGNTILLKFEHRGKDLVFAIDNSQLEIRAPEDRTHPKTYFMNRLGRKKRDQAILKSDDGRVRAVNKQLLLESVDRDIFWKLYISFLTGDEGAFEKAENIQFDPALKNYAWIERGVGRVVPLIRDNRIDLYPVEDLTYYISFGVRKAS